MRSHRLRGIDARQKMQLPGRLPVVIDFLADPTVVGRCGISVGQSLLIVVVAVIDHGVQLLIARNLVIEFERDVGTRFLHAAGIKK